MHDYLKNIMPLPQTLLAQNIYSSGFIYFKKIAFTVILIGNDISSYRVLYCWFRFGFHIFIYILKYKTTLIK